MGTAPRIAVGARMPVLIDPIDRSNVLIVSNI
jgi:hypothetical protein